MINVVDGIIAAIGKHIISKDTLTGGDEGVCIDESAPGGVVITGLEIIQPGFLVVDLTTIAQGVILAQSGSLRAGGS